jgi:uncharacterized protein (TIGR03000 family)
MIVGLMLGGLTVLAMAESTQACWWGGGCGWGGGRGCYGGYGGHGGHYGHAYGGHYGGYHGGHYASGYYAPANYATGFSNGYSYPIYAQPTYSQPTYTASAAEEQELAADQNGSRPARVRVMVPNNQVYLWFNGQMTTQGGRDRTFVTPALEPGSEYTYTVRGYWASEEGDRSWEKEVTVQPGQETVVRFPESEAIEGPGSADRGQQDRRNLDRDNLNRGNFDNDNRGGAAPNPAQPLPDNGRQPRTPGVGTPDSIIPGPGGNPDRTAPGNRNRTNNPDIGSPRNQTPPAANPGTGTPENRGTGSGNTGSSGNSGSGNRGSGGSGPGR